MRGNSVCPAEVEGALLRMPSVRRAVVLPVDIDGSTHLVGFVVSRTAPLRWRETLQAVLPEFMIPSALIAVERLPVAAGGKIDYTALNTMALSLLQQQAGRPTRAVAPYTPPRDPLEAQIVAIWEAVLNVQPIGVAQDFFALGGHSLLAARMLTRVERIAGRPLSLIAMHEQATVAHLADVIMRDTTGFSNAITELESRPRVCPSISCTGT